MVTTIATITPKAGSSLSNKVGAKMTPGSASNAFTPRVIIAKIGNIFPGIWDGCPFHGSGADHPTAPASLAPRQAPANNRDTTGDTDATLYKLRQRAQSRRTYSDDRVDYTFGRKRPTSWTEITPCISPLSLVSPYLSKTIKCS